MDERKLVIHIVMGMTIDVAFCADGAPPGMENRYCAVMFGLVFEDLCVGQFGIIACKFMGHKTLVFIDCGDSDGVIAAVQQFQNSKIPINEGCIISNVSANSTHLYNIVDSNYRGLTR